MASEANNPLEELQVAFRELKNSYDEKVKRNYEGSFQNDTSHEHISENFENVITRLNQMVEEAPAGERWHIKLLCMKSSIMYEEAKKLMSLDYLAQSQDMLDNALNVISQHYSDKQIAFLYMRLINHLSYLLSKKGDLERSRQLLEGVLENDELQTDVLVYSTEELFSDSEIDQSQANSKLNKLMANNLQMLGWIYGRMGQPDLHAEKQHMALEKQLEAGDCDPINWACRCSRLAALYLNRCNWEAARYHLVAAGAVLDRLEREMVAHPELSRAQADLARGWINYGLILFSNGVAKAQENKNLEASSEEQHPAEEQCSSSKQVSVQFSQFPSLEINTEGIPVQPVRTIEEARCLFLHSHTWLKRVRLYYSLRDFPIHYVNSVLDLSELYRFLALYESDLDSQYNVQRRRADALETLSSVLREVRPQCYIAVSVELLRELSEVQIEMMGINLRRLHMAGGSSEYEEKHLKRKVAAISEIHSKLESVGDMIGTANFHLPSTADMDLDYMNIIMNDNPN